MKRQSLSKRTILIIALAIALISVYQLFWLVNYYKDLKTQLNNDIQEVLRSSDFEELVNRVDDINKMNILRQVDVNMGYDHSERKSLTRSSVKGNDTADADNTGEDNTSKDTTDLNYIKDRRQGTQTVVSSKDFGDVLKSPEDLVGIGLNMQRAIHSALDLVMDVNVDFVDSIITRKLTAIGIGSDHQFYYIKKIDSSETAGSDSYDTLARKGIPNPALADKFTLKVSDSSEYQMIIENYDIVVLKKIIAVR